MALKYCENITFIYVLSYNIPSVRGIEKAEFKKYSVYYKIWKLIINQRIKKTILDSKICILPKVGEENPYQVLLMDGLQKGGFKVVYGESQRFFSILLTYFKNRPSWIHFDWVYPFYAINAPLFVKWSMLFWFKFNLWFIKKMTKCKIAFTLHNIMPHEKYHDKIDSEALHSIINSADVVRFFGEDSIRRLGEFLKEERRPTYFVMPEGSYVDYYPNNLSREEARKILGLNEEDIVFLYFGSIRPYKGVDILINEFNRVREKNWKLVIAGYRYHDQYCSLAEELCGKDENIKLFFGHHPTENVQIYFNAADIVVLPFKKIENSGSVILAMGFSKAIIAPKMGMVIERLSHQQYLLYEHSLEEVFQKIIKLNLKDFNEIGKINFREVQKNQWEDFSKLFKNNVSN